MKALVTGASGIVGANLVRELLAEGWSVRALVRPGPPRRALGGLDVELVYGDVRDLPSLVAATAGIDVVFHCAARFVYGADQTELERVAVTGTRNMIFAAATSRVARFVLTSSSVIFGSSTFADPRTEDATFTADDASGYAISKFRQSAAAFTSAAEHGVNLVAVCPALTMGAWDYGLSESNAIIVKYLNDPFRTTFTGGCNIVSAADIAHGHLLVAARGTAGRSYLLGGTNLSWRQLHSQISSLCGTTGPLVTASHTSAYLTAAWSEMMARGTGTTPALTREEVRMIGRWYWYDDSAARDIGYAPRRAQATLQEAIAWLMRTDHIRPDVKAWLQGPPAAPFSNSHHHSERA